MTTSPGTHASKFAGPSGAEHYISVQVEDVGDAADQLRELERRYANTVAELGLTPQSAVFRRLFVSDILNQMDLLKRSWLVQESEYDPVAVSIIEQAPLPGSKVALLAYHLSGGSPLVKHRLAGRHMLAEHNGNRHLFSTRLCGCATSSDISAKDQTRVVFDNLTDILASQRRTLKDNCVRTWIYVKGVDVFYHDMVKSRTAVFDEQDLTKDTHYIASTGIEGACAHQYDVVTMDAYSNLDLVPGQMTYLNDFAHLCPTNAYGVTFERGTKIAYADRAHHFISGTASIDREGQVVHRGDVMAQLDRTLENVGCLLASGGAMLDDLKHVIVYLRDPSDFPRIQARLSERLPDLPTVICHGAVCRPEWLVEIEGVAVSRN